MTATNRLPRADEATEPPFRGAAPFMTRAGARALGLALAAAACGTADFSVDAPTGPTAGASTTAAMTASAATDAGTAGPTPGQPEPRRHRFEFFIGPIQTVDSLAPVVNGASSSSTSKTKE